MFEKFKLILNNGGDYTVEGNKSGYTVCVATDKYVITNNFLVKIDTQTGLTNYRSKLSDEQLAELDEILKK